MKLGMMTSAALALGISAAAPLMTMADGWRHDHDRDYGRDRDDYRPVYRDEHREVVTVRDVALCDVPGRVMDRVNDYRHGRRIETAQVVCDAGHDYYQFRIDDRRNGDFVLKIEPSGHLFGRVDR